MIIRNGLAVVALVAMAPILEDSAKALPSTTLNIYSENNALSCQTEQKQPKSCTLPFSLLNQGLVVTNVSCTFLGFLSSFANFPLITSVRMGEVNGIDKFKGTGEYLAPVQPEAISLSGGQEFPYVQTYQLAVVTLQPYRGGTTPAIQITYKPAAPMKMNCTITGQQAKGSG